jgi:flagellar hook assembly protein FlgD
VQAVESSVWAATSGSGVTNAVAAPAPNATLVQAGIRWVGFSGGGTDSLGTTAAAVGRRSFSPDGDGSGDLLVIRWNNRHALESLTLRVLGQDGTLLGTQAVPATGYGTQDYGWDGTAGGEALPDGRYVLQLVGTSGGATSTWPADDPMAGDLPAQTGVVIDRVAPALQASRATGTRLSPNGDGTYDAMRISGTGSADVVRWEVAIAPVVAGTPGDPIRRIAGTGRTASAYWNGNADDGSRVPDGTYRATLRLFDAAGNAAARSWPAAVDATPPALSVTATPGALSPDGDDVADRVRLRWAADEPATGTLRVLRGTRVVRSWTIDGTGGTVAWDGRDAAGRVAADGRYAVSVTGSDALENRTTSSVPLVVDRTAGWLRWDPTAFHPQDGDRLAPTATVSVRVARATRLTLQVLDASGAVVRTAWRDREMARGTASWRWDGRAADGAWAPPGRYVAELTAVGPYGTTVLRRAVVADAFTAALSSETPRAGSRLSVTFRSVEPLATVPSATFRQAGGAPVRMAVVRLADGSWRATVAAGGPGPATVTLLGRDTGDGKNRTTLTVTVR